MSVQTAALVGAAGGAGATRLAVELGTLLAADGRDVAVLDAAYATEGLARHVAGRIDPDLTATVAGDAPLADALYDHPADDRLPGHLALAPAYAPFERLARAKTPAAAEAFEARVAAAAETFDHVLVDTPPVAANQAVASVTTVDRVGVVYPATDRGVDALQRVRGRLADVGAGLDCVVANRVDGDEVPPDADCAVPTSDVADATGDPAALDDATPTAAAMADVAAALLDVDVDGGSGGGLVGAARRRLQ